MLESPLTPITPLNHHFAALAALTFVELCNVDDTRSQAEQGLNKIEDAINRGRGLMARDGSSGWDSTIRELMAKASRTGLPLPDVNPANSGVSTSTAGLQHLADAAIANKPVSSVSADGAASAASAAAVAAAAAAVSGEGGVGGSMDASAFDPTLLTRYGYLAALAQEP